MAGNIRTALVSWQALNDYLKDASIEQVEKLIDLELTYGQRKSYLSRLIKRYYMLDAKHKIEQSLAVIVGGGSNTKRSWLK